jgi:hypothetical protein
MTEQLPPPPIQNPLTLVMTAKSPQDYAALQETVKKLQSLPPKNNPFAKALTNLAIVHFARFVFLDHNQFAVITTYDHAFDAYIDDFIDEVGEIFDELLKYVEKSPPLPVQAHRPEFHAFVRAHDLSCEGPFYSAYPNLAVVDILAMGGGLS